MKRLKYFLETTLTMALGLILFTGCDSESDILDNNDGPKVEPIVLDCSAIKEATVLKNRGSGIDYIWPCFKRVEAPLTIEPGVTIAFEQDAGMEVIDYGERTGSITAIGTAAKPITFTGTNKTPGAWRHISMNSGSLNNKFHHFIIEYAGGTDGSKAAISTVQDSKVEIQHTIFRNNKGVGMHVHGAANIEGWKANTFTKNQTYPLEIAARKIKFLDGKQSTYTDNGINEIYVNSGSIYNRGYIEDEVGGPKHTWLHPGIPFYIEENILVRNDRSNEKPGHLDIAEGTEIIFAEEYGIQVFGKNTALTILGTPDNQVKFSGKSGTGSWKGINIKQSNSTLNAIKNTIIADAGQSNWDWFNQKGGLSLGSQTGETININLTNLHITNSAACGVVERKLSSASNITYNNVTFSNNAGTDICEEN